MTRAIEGDVAGIQYRSNPEPVQTAADIATLKAERKHLVTKADLLEMKEELLKSQNDLSKEIGNLRLYVIIGFIATIVLNNVESIPAIARLLVK